MWRAQIEDLRAGAELWTGNPTSIIEVPESGMTQLADERSEILEEIRQDGVLLAGEDLSLEQTTRR